MKREEFIFTIGYQGNTAVIDGRTRKKNSGASFRELAEKGFYKAAYCAVLDSGDEAALAEFVSLFNSRVPGRPYTSDELSRLFGVYGVPQGIGLCLFLKNMMFSIYQLFPSRGDTARMRQS